MYRFWDTIIQPVLETLQPRIILEVGSDEGFNTRNLLEFCQRNGAKLHVVDPLPKYDVAAWQARYDEHLIFHRALSLDALPVIDGFDAVLIDGDHNWYTVFNELKVLEKQCKEQAQPFPLVLLHDIGWPYGRRDLYYNPETIPNEHLRPNQKKGLQPGRVSPVEEGGLNRRLDNAVSENDPRNGVLTAVEDFLKETRQAIDLIQVPGLHGLGILVPLRLERQNKELAEFLSAFKLSPAVARHIDLVEEARLDTELRREECKVRLKRLRARNTQVASRNRHLKQLLQEMRTSRSWRLLRKVRRIRSKVLRR